MNLKHFALSILAVSLLLCAVVHGEDLSETPLQLELGEDEITVRSGQKLIMKITVKNTSSEVIHAECIKSRVEYTTLGDIVVNTTTIEWEGDIYPSEVVECVHKSDLPIYTLPGTYTINVWVEYEGGRSEEVQMTLFYHNYYVYIFIACIINLLILYAKKVYRRKKH